MRPFTHTLPLDEARRLIERALVPVDRTELLQLDVAAWRVVARDIAAPRDVPPFDRAAMDGYAVRAADTAGATSASPVSLHLAGTAYTGDAPRAHVLAGGCVEIATGAPLPPGADAVVMVEDSTRHGLDTVHVRAPAHPFQHVGTRGSDIAAGHTVVGRGQQLNPARLGAVAALGFDTVEVFARPRVMIAATGNEVVEPGRPLRPGQIHDVNTVSLASVVNAHGGEAVRLPAVNDSLEALREAFAATGDADVVVFSGGSSVGERDLLVDVVRELGEVVFHGIAVKPGKPTLFGRVGSQLVLGMPGNPTSCLSNAYILLVPIVRRLARLPPWRPETRRLALSQRINSTPDRHQFYPVKLGEGVAIPVFKGSGDITSMSEADGYIEVPIGVGVVDEGTEVEVTLF